jgi:hypothetical protein
LDEDDEKTTPSIILFGKYFVNDVPT